MVLEAWEERVKPDSLICKEVLLKSDPACYWNKPRFLQEPFWNTLVSVEQKNMSFKIQGLCDFIPQTRGDAWQSPANAPALTSLCKKGFSHSGWALWELDASWAFVTLRVCSHKMPGASVPEQVSCLLFCHHSFAFTLLTEIAVLAESRLDLCLVPGNKGKALKGKECLNKFETCWRLKYRIKFRSLLLLHSLTSESLLFYSGSKSPTSLWLLSACWHRLRLSKDCKGGWISVRFEQLILPWYLDNANTQNKFLLCFN